MLLILLKKKTLNLQRCMEGIEFEMVRPQLSETPPLPPPQKGRLDLPVSLTLPSACFFAILECTWEEGGPLLPGRDKLQYIFATKRDGKLGVF